MVRGESSLFASSISTRPERTPYRKRLRSARTPGSSRANAKLAPSSIASSKRHCQAAPNFIVEWSPCPPVEPPQAQRILKCTDAEAGNLAFRRPAKPPFTRAGTAHLPKLRMPLPPPFRPQPSRHKKRCASEQQQIQCASRPFQNTIRKCRSRLHTLLASSGGISRSSSG